MVLAREYPGNSIHCPTLGPSPRLALSKDACSRVLPSVLTTGDAMNDMLAAMMM